MTAQKIQFVIDKYDNKEKKIKTRIPLGSLMLFIFFLIYIIKVFNKVLETSFLVTLLSFIDNLGFIALGSLVKKIVIAFKKIAKEVIA